MQTMNISLTADQVQMIDSYIAAYDYANRSEFFRAVLRLISQKPQVLQAAGELILEAPATRSAKKIISEMKATGHYSPKFLAGIRKGLAESRYFQD
jgi:Arc/MetJ-type ribon-helix-helix transcriptional regulator